MSATTTHRGLPDGMQPFALLELIENLKSELGLIDQDITYLRWVFRRLKRTDFIEGRICAVWMSVAKLAVGLRVSPRKVHRIEERLQRCGIVLKASLANGRRYGRRSEDGLILRAGGINLAPVINRASELANNLRLSRLAAIDLKDDQERASDLIREIRSLGSEEALAAAKSAFPRLRPTEVQTSVRLAEIIEALATVLADFSEIDGRTEETAPSDTLDRPSTKKEKIIKTCSVTRKATRPKPQTPPAQVRLLASNGFAEIIDMYADGIAKGRFLSWQIVAMAARERAQMIGITGDQWEIGCELVGEVSATLGLLLIDRNLQRSGRYKVDNAATAFAGMMRKEARENAVIGRLIAELQAFAKSSMHPSIPMTITQIKEAGINL